MKSLEDECGRKKDCLMVGSATITTTTSRRLPGARQPAHLTQPVLPLGWAVVTSALAGVGLDTAFPELGWWPIAFVSVTLALIALAGRRAGGAFLVGLVYGGAFYVTHLSWAGRFLGPLPWLGLAGLQALLFAVGAVPIALAFRWSTRALRGRWGQLVVVPLLVGGLWTLRETVMGSWPYGGFPWARLGMSQATSPFAEAVSWVGVAGLSFLIATVCAGIGQWWRVGRGRDWRGLVMSAAVTGLLLVTPQFPTTPAGEMTVGWVQGNGPAGYFDAAAPGAMLTAQTAATMPLIGQPMDVLVWPEGGVGSDPLNDPGTGAALDELSRWVSAPLLVNAATRRGVNTYNTSLLWPATGGVVQLFDKANPVPFGEYVPDRWFYQRIAPDLIGLIGREYTPGINSPYVSLNGVGVGLAICFDVIFDDVIWRGAQDGAQLYLLQSNNGDFRGTDENLQQAAFARMRAIETGRGVVNVATTGTSQALAPDGPLLDELPADTAGARVTTIPLRAGLTPAVALGPWIAGLLSATSLLGLLLLGLAARR